MIDIINKNNVNIAKRSEAFTLAEVLITLTIIGVIAAITIPNLIQSYKKHQVEVGVKEAYSILSNAIKMAETEYGDASEWNFGAQNSSLPKNIVSYLKVAKDCGYRSANNDCMKPIYTMNGTERDWGSWTYYVSLDNGMSLAICPRIYNYADILADINGPNKGKNTLGEDVFAFSLMNKNHYRINTNFWPGRPHASYGAAINVTASVSELLNSSVDGCNAENTGYQCSAAIAKNGWKIPDDYPIKKW